MPFQVTRRKVSNIVLIIANKYRPFSRNRRRKSKQFTRAFVREGEPNITQFKSLKSLRFTDFMLLWIVDRPILRLKIEKSSSGKPLWKVNRSDKKNGMGNIPKAEESFAGCINQKDDWVRQAHDVVGHRAPRSRQGYSKMHKKAVRIVTFIHIFLENTVTSLKISSTCLWQ